MGQMSKQVDRRGRDAPSRMGQEVLDQRGRGMQDWTGRGVRATHEDINQEKPRQETNGAKGTSS